MEEYIIKLAEPTPKARYQCKKCDKYFSDITKIKTHLNSKKPCDVELAILKKITEYNVSETDGEYECKFCQYKTKKRAEFTRHINRTLSCYYTTEYIDGKEIRLKNDKEYLVSSSTEGKEVLELLCKECYQNNVIKRGKDGKCIEHGGEKYEYKRCIEEGCDEKGTQKMEGYCRKHYILLVDKEEKVNQCSKCKVVFSDNRTLKKHVEKDDCLEKIAKSQQYDNFRISVDGYTRYKCNLCDAIFELDKFKQHQAMKSGLCLERKKIRDCTAEFAFSDENNCILYKCNKCDKQYDIARRMYHHISSNCDKPDEIIEEIDGKTIVFRNNNKYVRTISPNGSINDNQCCQEDGCFIVFTANNYCKKHGGNTTERRRKCLNDCDKYPKKNGFCINCFKILSEDEMKQIRDKVYMKNSETIFLSCAKKLINSYKDTDRKKGIDVNSDNYVTPEYIYKLYIENDSKCFHCDRIIKCATGTRHQDQISVDRINSQKPHTKDNIKIVCLFCNLAKNGSKMEYWVKYINALKTDGSYEKEGVIDNCWIHKVIVTSKKRATKKNTDFSLTEEWIKEQFENNKYSHYTGIEMFPSKIPYYPFKPSIDRIDNSKGYTQDNCVLCCLSENLGRNNMLYEEFKEWLDENFPKKVEKEPIKIKIKKLPIKVL